MKQRIIAGIGIAAMMALLAGCDEIKFNGSMNISEPITFAGQNRVNVVLNPGQFQTKATIGQSGKKKQIKLEIKNANPATTVQLEFDKNINIGETFNLTAAQIGQNFGMAGTLATKVEKGDEQWGRESCTYQEPQTICRSVAKSANEETASKTLGTDLGSFAQDSDTAIPEASNPVMVERGPNPGQFTPPPPHTPTCYTQWVSRPGWMDVRFYYETTVRDIAAGFVQGEKTLGNYQGHSSETQKINTYQGRCGW